MTELDIATTEDAAALLSYGQQAAERQDTQNARAALRKATKLDPTNVAAWLALAQVVGTFSERRQAYQRALELDPQNIAAQGGLQALEAGVVNPHGNAARPAPVIEPVIVPATELGTCYRHPNVETGLRCIQCGNYICARCAQATPVGYLCPDCRKARRSPLYNVETADIVKAAAVGVVAGALGAIVTSIAAGAIFLFLFFIAPMIGEGLMRAITWATRKRGIVMQITAALSLMVGAGLAYLFIAISPLAMIIFLVIAMLTVVARLK